MNVGDPDHAFAVASLPNDGVGLARLEFIINNHIGIHPMALVRYPALQNPDVVKEIARRGARKTRASFHSSFVGGHCPDCRRLLSKACDCEDVGLQIKRVCNADRR